MGYDLPERLSRGKRGRNALEDDADADFWEQDFFKEEDKDEEYESESVEEDVADSDFSDSEEDDDEPGEEPEAEPRRKRRILPPGTTQGGKNSSKVNSVKSLLPVEARADDDQQLEEGGLRDIPTLKRSDPVERQDAPILRKTTMKRRELAEQERQRQEELRTRRKRAEPVHKYKPLTQAEMLKEAAQTEIRNTESLQQLVAMEEETKKKALEKRAKYVGPLVRVKSCKVNDMEQTTMEWCNMPQPEWAHKMVAPLPKQICAVTGLPARYKDPVTGLAYATVEAFKEIRRRSLGR